MSTLVKASVIACGYAGAFLLASAVVAVRVAATSGPVAQASSGMYAFGDAVVFVGVFGVAALVPTGGALFFLSSFRTFWTVLASFGVAVACTGVVAAVLYAVGRGAAPSLIATLAMVSVLRILIAPLLALTFLVCTVFAPRRTPRFAFLAATLMEASVSTYAAAIWFLPLLLQRA